MARHLLRDYLTQSSSNTSSTFIGSYLATIFMRRVLLYTYVGDTNYNINSVGTLLISTADSTPTGTPTFAGGTRAGINLGANREYNVSIPVGTRTVSSTDVGRILVLRSVTNPTYNSGCFLITGFDVGTNSYVVDYRSGTTMTTSTAVGLSSNGVNLPTGTINALTAGFPTSGTILVQTTAGTQTVNYTGLNAGVQFTGCTGGTGTMATGNSINLQLTLPQTTIPVVSTSVFPPSGTLFIYSSAGRQTVTYTGITGTTFTGCSGGTGTINSGTSTDGFSASVIISGNSTTIAAGSNGQSLPQATINVAATATASTTIAAGSNGQYLPQGTINVASTTGFPTSGVIYVTSLAGRQIVAYTGTTATTFTGCTGGFGVISTGNAVYAGFPPSGRIFVTTGAGVQQVNYTGVTGTTFTGCSGGTGTMSTGGVVYYSASLPPMEASDSMNWYLYERDSTASAALVQGASNGNSAIQYRGSGTSTTPRLTLQSPNALAWQVRICHETTNDSGVGNSPISSQCPLISFAPGFEGDSAGDFPTNGKILHSSLYYNSNSTTLRGGTIGFGDNRNIPSGTGTMQYRITIAGDDDGYGVTIFGRRPGNATFPRSYYLSFGMSDNEPPPLPPNPEARLYVIGSSLSTSGGDSLNDLSWYPGNIGTAAAQGVTMRSAIGAVPIPVSANIGMLTYAIGSTQQGSPIFDGSAGDSPWIGSIELFGVDVVSGMFNNWTSTVLPPFTFPELDGRFLGTIPHIREGRANFAEYRVTADNGAQHMRRGLWLLWGGPPPVA